MKKKTVFSYSYKYLYLFFLSLIFTFFNAYIISLISMFIGEILAIFAGESHVLPAYLARFVRGSNKYEQIVSLCIMMAVMAIITMIARILQAFSRNIAAYKIEINISSAFFNHALRLPKSYLVSHSTGDIIQRNIQDSSKFAGVLRGPIYYILSAIFSIITVLMQIFYLNKINFFIGFAIICAILVFGVVFSWVYIREREKIASELASSVDSRAQQTFSNIQMVKSFANEEVEEEKFAKQVDELQGVKYQVERAYSNYWLVMDGFSCFYSFLSILVVGLLCFNGYFGIGAAASLILLNGRIVDDTTELISNINSLLRNSVSISRLNEYLKVEEDYDHDGTLTPLIEGEIEFSHVSMAYKDDPSQEILSDVSFKVNKGEVIGIVGKSGSGKSTIINVLTKLDDYDSGSIKIDGVELKEINKHYLRENMGIVNQNSFVFSKTIEENILILDDKHTDYEEYIDRVCLREDINKMPKGIKTLVGERGVTLSGGQRQRISIARSLIKNKNILILDDSLSAIDNNVAKEIKKSLKKNNCTTFIISHNLMNVLDADKILVMENGRIVQQGNHESLVKEKGWYKQVFNLQQNIKEEGGK